jgi:predicted regulator of Ras-like GTPase activity (Roadblock/LC7/MglB family)
MSAKIEDSLKKVTSLNGVKAAFVFNQYQAVLVREVPGNYPDEMLKRMASQFHQLLGVAWANGVNVNEFRFLFSRFLVYMRSFGQGLYLVVFVDREVSFADVRQPLNLAVLVLEKTFRKVDEAIPESEMTLMAAEAEKTLRSAVDRDDTFAGAVQKACLYLAGRHGRELVDCAIEDEMLIIPIRSEEEMRKLINYIIPRVTHPLRRRLLENELNKILDQTLKAA